MKAPDKIYLSRFKASIHFYLGTETKIAHDWRYAPEKSAIENIAYIRMDAVMDILKNAKHLGDVACKIDEL